MYNLSGLYYQMKSNVFVFGAIGLLFLVCSRFWIVEKRNIKELSIGLLCCLLCICSICYHFYVVNDIKVSTYEGIFVEEHREQPYLFRMEYCFWNKKGQKPLFYLDVFSKKHIYPKDFKTNEKYRIYYEEKTDVILRIEQIE